MKYYSSTIMLRLLNRLTRLYGEASGLCAERMSMLVGR